MGPRGQTLPQATTESAREARKSFFCELCQKGYARMNDFEAHEGSYDHSHRKRLKEMRQLSKDPNAAAKAREAERKANEESGLKSINISLATSAGNSTGVAGKKKPVFKSTLQPHNAAVLGQQPPMTTSDPTPSAATTGSRSRVSDDEYWETATHAKANGWYEDAYDPLAGATMGALICDDCERAGVRGRKCEHTVFEWMTDQEGGWPAVEELV